MPGMISGLMLLPTFWYFGIYHEVARYSGIATLQTSAKAFAFYTCAFFVIIVLFTIDGVPRSIGVLQPLVLGGILLNSRLLIRSLDSSVKAQQRDSATRVMIFGTGEFARQVALSLNVANSRQIVGFIEETSAFKGSTINGVLVYGGDIKAAELRRLQVSEILVASYPDALSIKTQITAEAAKARVSIRTFSNIGSTATQNSPYEIKEFEIEDLLGRELVKPDRELLCANVTAKRVLISGAGGSIGSELVQQVINLNPKALVLIDNSEANMYHLLEKIRKNNNLKNILIHEELCSINDRDRLFNLFETYRPDSIFHCAAYKHVHLVESNPFAGLETNYFGTVNLAEAAIEFHAESFLLISSDKAVRPTNVMGATKRLAELKIKSFAQSQDETKFVVVRFGNVLGSSGSVVPAFRQQIRDNGPVLITHPEIERYFMTIGEAVELVIQASSIALNGEILLLDMGKPVKIKSLAKQMIALSGLTVKDQDDPNGQIEISYVGLRPGEKLYEELLVDGQAVETIHPRIFKADENVTSVDVFCEYEHLLSMGTPNQSPDDLKEIMSNLVPDYSPEFKNKPLAD